MGPKTEGEQVFEAYLAERGLAFRYEPDLGAQTRPDYLVRSTPEVLCDVKDFEAGEEDELARKARQKAAAQGLEYFELCGIDPYARIRSKIRIARVQLRHFKGRYPTVVVLFNSASPSINLMTEVIEGAMYGDLVFRMKIGPPDANIPTNITSGHNPQNAMVRPKKNTSISAVAVLEHFRPNDYLLRAEYTRNRRSDPKSMPSAKELAELLEKGENFIIQHPEVQDTVVRMRVVHNRHAALALPNDVFSGPHDIDVQWSTEKAISR